MIWFYRVLFIPLLIITMPYYAMRMIRRGGYAKDFSQRFGSHKKLPNKTPDKKRIWLQAVSVGEIEAIAKLVELINADNNLELVITTTTSTGYKLLKERYNCLYKAIFPFDFFLCSRRAWNKIEPDLIILMESELWPEHLHQAKLRNVPALLINARISDRSFKRYNKFKFFALRLFNKLNKVCVSSDFDYQRFAQLGIDNEKMISTGNLKFDQNSNISITDNEKSLLKDELGFDEKSLILLGSSTWQNEEKMLIEALKELRKLNIDARLLLVPRHAERRNEIIPLLKDFPHHIRSQSKKAKENTIIYLADTTGELKIFTQIADIAFIGKSLFTNKGGQTPIDCAYAQIAMLYGNNMSNFRIICTQLEKAQASLKVNSPQEAIESIIKLAKDKTLRKQLAKNAKAVHTKNIGASLRTFEVISEILG